MISLKKEAYAFVVLILIIFGAASRLSAQDMMLSDARLRQEYKILQQKIESAKLLLTNLVDERILTLVRKAERKKDEAYKYWQDKQLAKARTAVQIGMKNINTALKFLLQNPLQLQQKQLAVLLERLERFPNRARMKDAEILYKKAKEKESLAKRAAGNGDFAKAIELLRLGITFADKALAAYEKNQSLSVERVRFIETASRVRDAVEASNNPAERRVYDQAMKQGKNAVDAYHDGHMAASAGLYTEGMKLLLRAFDLASASRAVNKQDLRVELQAVEDLLQTAQSKFDNQAPRAVRFMLNRARKSTQRAATAMANGNYSAAKAQLQFSRGLLNKLFRRTFRKPGQARDRAELELRRLRTDIEAITARTGQRLSAAAREYLRLARRSANAAGRVLDHGNFNLALNRILVAQRFLSKIETAAQTDQSPVTESAAVAQINQLQQALQQSGDLQNTNQLVKSLVDEAERMYKQAGQMLSDQQYAPAFELADVGLELIKKALRAARNQ